jgi:type II secretion system (T2SS) protein C
MLRLNINGWEIRTTFRFCMKLDMSANHAVGGSEGYSAHGTKGNIDVIFRKSFDLPQIRRAKCPARSRVHLCFTPRAAWYTLTYVKIEQLHLLPLSGPATLDSAIRLLAGALTLGAIVLLGRWLSVLTAPRPVAELPSAVITRPEWSTQAVSRLFGSGAQSSPLQAMVGLHLTGVFAGSKGGGFATIHTQRGEVPVFSGDEVAPGVILKHVERDRVILLVSGIQKELPLHETSVPAVVSPRAPYRRGSPSQAEEE